MNAVPQRKRPALEAPGAEINNGNSAEHSTAAAPHEQDEANAALQTEMIRLMAEENASKITAPQRKFEADSGRLAQLASSKKFVHTETGAWLEPETVAEALVQQAARLDDLAYDAARKHLADNAGIRVATLDAERAKLRGAQSAGGAKPQGAAVLFNEPEPWPEPVDGAQVIADITRILASYVHMPNGAATATSLWIAASHCFDSFQHAPRLNITAATRGCGKTLLLDVVATLCRRALRIENLTQAVLFRIVGKHQPTLLVDECDRHLKDNQELVGLLNAGFTRGGVVPRCEGDQNEVRLFPVFAPVALSGIGNLPGTLHDRSIVIHLERARPAEVAQRFDSRHTEHETEIKRKVIRWCADNHAVLTSADPVMPQAFNRVADVWRPLFAVALVAGGDWPARCAKAFAKLQRVDADDEPVAVQLLQDSATIMDTAGTDTMPSAELVERLAALDEKPWPAWNHGKPISPRQVANMLRGFGVRPQKFRDDAAGLTPGTRGYHRRDFVEPLSRYVLSATTPQPSAGAASELFASATATNPVADKKTPNTNGGAACGAVADKTGGVSL